MSFARDMRGSTYDRVLRSVLEDCTVGLNDVSSVVSRDLYWGVGDIELVDEREESRRGGVDETANRRIVAVVVRHCLTRILPAELNAVSRLRQRSAVVGDGRVVAILQEARLVGHRKEGEDRELDARVLRRALDDVSGKQRPLHGLRDARLEPHGERVRSGELTEGHLLPGFRGDRLEK